ncbi:hypothetical protein HD598_000834 [Neomicrococcus aestuarii]|uniref:Uncharacterized protein n=1 Tax=Neomicrococcus aestuarii TaxID=556325 RepID=A0A7W8TSJ1_9MICC|nr:hypothetical protein [Neomicrococcus aestuarii]MBB5512147.1 hypothetical protein [Neomicrococcus aestuarii]
MHDVDRFFRSGGRSGRGIGCRDRHYGTGGCGRNPRPAAVASEEGNPGMARMHELMTEGNPGMTRMHELMAAPTDTTGRN